MWWSLSVICGRTVDRYDNVTLSSGYVIVSTCRRWSGVKHNNSIANPVSLDDKCTYFNYSLWQSYHAPVNVIQTVYWMIFRIPSTLVDGETFDFVISAERPSLSFLLCNIFARRLLCRLLMDCISLQSSDPDIFVFYVYVDLYIWIQKKNRIPGYSLKSMSIICFICFH